MRDSAGVTIVENTNRGVWSSSNRWRIEPGDVRIGSADGDPDYEFGQIAGLAVTGDGRIFVFDQQAQQIKVFDQDGLFLNTIGRPGGGPGEIAAGAGPVLLGAGDTLFVPDAGNRRVDLFTADGEDAGSFVLDVLRGIPLAWAATTDGRLVNHLRPLRTENSSPSDTMDIVVIRNTAGEMTDTILSVPSGGTFTITPGALPEWNFFSPEPVWALGEGRAYYFGINDDYRIGVHDETGDLITVITKPYEAQPVTNRDQQVFKDFFEGILQEQPGVNEQILGALMNNVHFYETYPAYGQFMSGPRGTLWVQLIQRISELTDEEAENFNPLLNLGAAEWDVFDSDGRFLGQIAMPPRFQPLRFVDTDIYGIWRDDFDVQYVLKVGIVGVPGGDV
jgi:hypothetical protein